MTRLHLAASLALCVALLSACIPPVVGKVASRLAGQAPEGAGVPAVQAEPGAPTIKVNFVSFGASVDYQRIDQDGSVQVWLGADGSQIALRDGILIWTKGLGGDLMSSEAPLAATLKIGAQHNRTNHYIEGSDSRFKRSYTCLDGAPETGEGPANLRRIEQTCEGQTGILRYLYGIDAAGTVAWSKQWVSNSVGYLEIAH